ncbi:MAG: thioesterase [Sedimentisphaerales bacterium]
MDAREFRFTVRTSECQPDGRIKMASLMQYLQEAAALHAEQLGVGFERLSEMDVYWVLSNFKIEIARLPRWSEEVTIRTWPSGYNRAIASREFVGADRKDQEVFKAGSEWMILSKRTNRPRNLFRLDLNLPKTGVSVLPDPMSRLQRRDDYRAVDHVRVPYSSIDLNGHVNNTEYVRWSFDVLRQAFGPDGGIRWMQVTYLSEVFEGDEVELLVSSVGSGRFHVLGSKLDTQSDVYLMEVGCL